MNLLGQKESPIAFEDAFLALINIFNEDNILIIDLLGLKIIDFFVCKILQALKETLYQF